MKALRRAARSLSFFAVYGLWTVFYFGLVQRLVIWPLAVLLPKRRTTIVGAWFNHLARSTLVMARWLAGVRVRVRGSVPPGSCVVIMNHQSLIDIPLAYAHVGPPLPVIPTRRLYARGIPGISLLIRLGRLPLVDQKPESRRMDVLAIARAADAVARGELGMVIFPEGHRTHDGEIGRFMSAGLRAILSRAQRPVYILVVDGFWRARTTTEALLRFAEISATLRVAGPFPPPPEAEIDAFIEQMYERMCAELRAAREEPPDQGRAERAK
jgi:1-acyl-sn-glycerol-3-phosphate acyltransferase